MSTSRFAAALVRNIRAERTRAGITQAQLAERMGWSEKTVARTEQGDRRLYFDEVPALCRALGVPLDRLLLDVDAEDLAALRPPERG
jgi:transcriptional regulator with XRE-family HTH domain